MLYQFIISVLNDDCGISSDAYENLLGVLDDTNKDFKRQLLDCVEGYDGRYYIDEASAEYLGEKFCA